MSAEDSINFPVVQKDLSGKTVAVIGANTGIGLEAAKHFARMNPARLILACRTYEKGQAAASQIKNETGYEKTESWPIELTDFSTVRAFAERFEKEDVPLDILLNNAAVAIPKYEKTVDGWETTVQVNHLSLALLTILLLPRLLDTAKKHGDVARVVAVSSRVHAWTDFRAEKTPFDKVLHTLNLPETSLQARYQETKLSNLLFVRALNQHLPSNAPIVIDAPCPGFCISDLRRNLDESLFAEALKLARTAEEGSRQLIYAALAPTPEDEAKGIHLDAFKGAFLSQTAIAQPSEWVLSEEGKKVQDGLWEETIQILSKVDPKFTAILQECKLH
ncbi:NAD(P)-binding domain superfamily protein [Abortiporus biennis]